MVNLTELGKIDALEVNRELLLKRGLVRSRGSAIKILGNGSIDKAMTVYADAFSATAREKIEKAGGKAIVGQPAAQKQES